MQRPTKAKEVEGLKQPLLPTSTPNETSKAKRSSSSVFGFPRTIVAILTLAICHLFATDETVYLIAGEWIAVCLLLVTVAKAHVASESSHLHRQDKADKLLDFYVVFLVVLRFLAPLDLIYILLAMASLLQSVLLGIEVRIYLRSEEQLNRKRLDEEGDGVFGLVGGTDSNTHWGVRCELCDAYPIVGIRYRAKECSEFHSGYNVCEMCLAQMSSTVPQFQSNFVAISTALPLSEDTLQLLRNEEAQLFHYKKMQKERQAREALLLASVRDPEELDIV